MLGSSESLLYVSMILDTLRHFNKPNEPEISTMLMVKDPSEDILLVGLY